jgi:hypothetical protein
VAKHFGNMMIKFVATKITLIIAIITQFSFAGEFSGNVALETKLFPQDPLSGKQKSEYSSLSISPEYYFDWDSGDQSILIAPFYRYDFNDDERTHFDIRELFWQYVVYDWELRVGFRKVYWGVAESNHLVDVINQTDFVENINGEQKLGQPMLNFALIQDWGTVEAFVLTGFRERTFAGLKGRPGFPLKIDVDHPKFESDDEEKHIDWALRYSHTLGDWDIGISHFSGTSREARLVPQVDNFGKPVKFVPFYDQMDQSALELQTTLGGWLLKGELISRQSRGKRFTAFASGFEYTFGDVAFSGIDIGVLTEYLFDDRTKILDAQGQEYFPFTLFDDHFFIGSRLAFNDVQSTDLLGGVIVDRESGSLFFTVEGSRRIGEDYKLILQLGGFGRTNKEEILHSFRKDSFIQLELARYF